MHRISVSLYISTNQRLVMPPAEFGHTFGLASKLISAAVITKIYSKSEVQKV